jgi:urease accessory protein
MAHPFTGLDHILAMTAVGIFAANLGGAALWAVPLTFMGLMAVGGALGMAGILLPHVEAVIALSVIILGVAIYLPRQWPLIAVMALVGLFGVFHGHAHGTEMAATVSGAECAAGFVCGTGILHLVGVLLGLTMGRLDRHLAAPVARLSGAVIAVAGISLLVT